jgi:hypothetical protein
MSLPRFHPQSSDSPLPTYSDCSTHPSKRGRSGTRDLLRSKLLEERRKEVDRLETLDVRSGGEFIVPDWIVSMVLCHHKKVRGGASAQPSG